MDMAHSHQDHLVGLNNPVMITCQGDISELGFMPVVCCSWHSSSMKNNASHGEKWHTQFPINNRPYSIDNIVHTCITLMMFNAHDGEQNIYEWAC